MSITHKYCSKCKEDKEINEFKTTRRPNDLTQHCEQCRKEEYQRTRERHLAHRKKVYAEKKDQILESMKTPEAKEKRNARNRARRKIDPAFRISESLKVRIHEILKEYKDETSNYLLGVNKIFLKRWMEFQFGESISWENFSKEWHIDHVIPISFFDVTQKEQQKICFNWMNLRPLNKTKNIQKHSKILKEDIVTHAMTVKSFIDQNTDYQECFEKSIWPRIELGYGKNVKDDENFVDFLKSIIRIEDSKPQDLLKQKLTVRLKV